MTFRVEHVTPGKIRDHFGDGVDRALRAALPFDIDVMSVPVLRTQRYESTCGCKYVYVVSDTGVQHLKRIGLFRNGLKDGANPCVCLCTGAPVTTFHTGGAFIGRTER